MMEIKEKIEKCLTNKAISYNRYEPVLTPSIRNIFSILIDPYLRRFTDIELNSVMMIDDKASYCNFYLDTYRDESTGEYEFINYSEQNGFKFRFKKSHFSMFRNPNKPTIMCYPVDHFNLSTYVAYTQFFIPGYIKDLNNEKIIMLFNETISDMAKAFYVGMLLFKLMAQIRLNNELPHEGWCRKTFSTRGIFKGCEGFESLAMKDFDQWVTTRKTERFEKITPNKNGWYMLYEKGVGKFCVDIAKALDDTVGDGENIVGSFLEPYLQIRYAYDIALIESKMTV